MKKLNTIVVATRNPSKIDYYSKKLKLVANNVVGLTDFSIGGKPTESGTTSEENAKLKAEFYFIQIGKPVFSEDEALYVDFLPKESQPGTHVRRINGKDEVDDATLLNYWENLIYNVPDIKRAGNWHISYCIAFSKSKVTVASVDHPIKFYYPASKIILPGWPMSSLQGSTMFAHPQSEYTAAEIEKSKIERAQEFNELLSDMCST